MLRSAHEADHGDVPIMTLSFASMYILHSVGEFCTSMSIERMIAEYMIKGDLLTFPRVGLIDDMVSDSLLQSSIRRLCCLVTCKR